MSLEALAFTRYLQINERGGKRDLFLFIGLLTARLVLAYYLFMVPFPHHHWRVIFSLQNWLYCYLLCIQTHLKLLEVATVFHFLLGLGLTRHKVPRRVLAITEDMPEQTIAYFLVLLVFQWFTWWVQLFGGMKLIFASSSKLQTAAILMVFTATHQVGVVINAKDRSYLRSLIIRNLPSRQPIASMWYAPFWSLVIGVVMKYYVLSV